MIDEKEMVGCAAFIVGVVALFYADWKLVPIGVILVLLFSICALIAFLLAANRFIPPIFLTFSVIIARWWVREYAITIENGWHPGLMALFMVATVTASVGTIVGMLVRQGLDRRNST